MSVKNRLKEFIKTKNLTIRAFEDSIDASNGYVNSISKGIGETKLNKIIEIYPNLDIQWLLTGIEQKDNVQEFSMPNPEIIPNKNGNEFVDLGGGLLLMKVPLLEINAQAGFADNFQDTEFLTGIEDFHSIIVKNVHKGRYLAFRVKGDSMDDGSSESILPNSIVVTRELQRQHWRDQLWYRKRPYWVIATKESRYPLLKQIVGHDTEKGIINCHSLNDGPEYGDFTLSLNDVTALFYVTNIDRNIIE